MLDEQGEARHSSCAEGVNVRTTGAGKKERNTMLKLLKLRKRGVCVVWCAAVLLVIGAVILVFKYHSCKMWTWCDGLVAVANCAGVLGGLFVYYRWRTAKSIQRAEFLGRLIQRFKEINYDEFLRRVEQSSDTEQDGGEELDEGVRAYDFLIFLSYVCYLKNADVIDDAEFLSFRCYVDRALRLNVVREYLIDSHRQNFMTVAESPYSALLSYGKDANVSGMVDLCVAIDENYKLSQQESGKGIISVTDGRTYRTHLDVLNGIFKKGLLQHASGGSPLDENNTVWFPHIYKDKTAAGNRLWYNTLSDNGLELREHCTDAEKRFGGDKDKPKVFRRYVFAKFMDGNPSEYKFIGIFDFKEKEPSAQQNEICWLYVRTADSFDPNSKSEVLR